MTPADLREAADVLRRSASFVPLAFADVGPRSDAETWQGPVADVFRGGLRATEARVAGVADGLRAVALRLEARADRLRVEIEAASREAERRRAEEACGRAEIEAAGGEERLGPFAVGGAPCGRGTVLPPAGSAADGADGRGTSRDGVPGWRR